MRNSTIFLILIPFGLILMGYLHEQVHVQIYESYDIESKVEYFKGFPNFQTVVTDAKGECLEECELAHNINEAIGYPLLIIYFMLTFGFYFLIREAEERNIYK